MSAPDPSKRPQAGGSSLVTFACLTTEVILDSDLDKPDGPFWVYYHKFESVDDNRGLTCTCKLCNKQFEKLNTQRSRRYPLKISGKGVAVCTKITDAQHVRRSKCDSQSMSCDRRAQRYMHVLTSFSCMFYLLHFWSHCMAQLVRRLNDDSPGVSRDRRTHPNKLIGPFPKM